MKAVAALFGSALMIVAGSAAASPLTAAIPGQWIETGDHYSTILITAQGSIFQRDGTDYAGGWNDRSDGNGLAIMIANPARECAFDVEMSEDHNMMVWRRTSGDSCPAVARFWRVTTLRP